MKKIAIVMILVFMAGCSAIGGQRTGSDTGTFGGRTDMSYQGGR